MICKAVRQGFDRLLSFHPLIVLVLIGALIRIPLSILFTHSYDVYYWALIQENLQSGNGLYGLPGYYYTPVWGYFMAIIGYVSTAVFGFGTLGVQCDPLVFVNSVDWEYYRDLIVEPGFCLVYKILISLGDILVSLMLYLIVIERTDDKKKGVIAFALWWFCPLMIYTATVHVMFDAFPILLALVATYLLMKKRYFLAGMAFSIAALEKLFPAYFMFVFIGYIIAINDGDRKAASRNIVSSVLGALAMAVVILLPDLLQGDLISAFGMISNRITYTTAEENETLWDILTSKGYLAVMIFQPLVFAIQFYIMYRMAKTRKDIDGTFLFLMVMASASIFLWTPTPTYLMIIIPFLIIYSTVGDRDYRIPYLLLAVFATCYAVTMQNFSDLFQTASSFGLVSYDTLKDGIGFLNSRITEWLSVQSLLNITFGALETVSIYSVFAIWFLKKRRTTDVPQ